MKLKKIAVIFSTILLIICALIFSKEISIAVKGSLILCFQAVIPSLFFFFIISTFAQNSGVIDIISYPFNYISNKLFHLSKSCTSSLIIGYIAGFPCGSISASKLYNEGKISKKEALCLLSFTNNANPAFVISIAGKLIFNSTKIGVYLLIIQFLSSLITGIVYSRIIKPDCNNKSHFDCHLSSITTAFVSAVKTSVLTVLNICGFIIFFSTVTSLISTYISSTSLLYQSELISVINGVLELTGGLNMLSLCDNFYFKFIFASIFINFSGICVFFQSSMFIKEAGLSTRPYITGKLIQTAISVAISLIVANFIDVSEYTFSQIDNITDSTAGIIYLSIFPFVLLFFAFVGVTFSKSVKKDFIFRDK